MTKIPSLKPHEIRSHHFLMGTDKRLNITTKQLIIPGMMIQTPERTVRVHTVKDSEASKYYPKHTFYEIKYY